MHILDPALSGTVGGRDIGRAVWGESAGLFVEIGRVGGRLRSMVSALQVLAMSAMVGWLVMVVSMVWRVMRSERVLGLGIDATYAAIDAAPPTDWPGVECIPARCVSHPFHQPLVVFERRGAEWTIVQGPRRRAEAPPFKGPRWQVGPSRRGRVVFTVELDRPLTRVFRVDRFVVRSQEDHPFSARS